jgi:hypothetical protein
MMAKETKAVGIEFGKPAKPAAQIEAKVGGRPLWIGIKKC